MSLVGLWGLAVAVRHRRDIRSVTGLKTQYVLAGFVTALLVRNGLVSESLNVTFAFVDICTDVFWKNTKFR